MAAKAGHKVGGVTVWPKMWLSVPWKLPATVQWQRLLSLIGCCSIGDEGSAEGTVAGCSTSRLRRTIVQNQRRAEPKATGGLWMWRMCMLQLLRVLDSETMWKIDLRTIVFLLNSLDPQHLSFSEQDVIDVFDVLFNSSRNEEVDFDEFLYKLAIMHKVSYFICQLLLNSYTPICTYIGLYT